MFGINQMIKLGVGKLLDYMKKEKKESITLSEHDINSWAKENKIPFKFRVYICSESHEAGIVIENE